MTKLRQLFWQLCSQLSIPGESEGTNISSHLIKCEIKRQAESENANNVQLSTSEKATDRIIKETLQSNTHL